MRRCNETMHDPDMICSECVRNELLDDRDRLERRVEGLLNQRARVRGRLCSLRDAAHAGNQPVNAGHIQAIINLTLDKPRGSGDE